MPYKDKAQELAAKRKTAAKRRAAGLCSRCNTPRLPDDSRCQAHRDAERKQPATTKGVEA